MKDEKRLFKSLLSSLPLRFLFLAIFLTLSFFTYHVSSFPATEVVVEGVGEIVSGQTAWARDEAIQDGFRRAIEKAIGTYISSKTKVENLQVIKDKIYMHSKGYVTDWEVISEKEKEDLYRVKIRAWVKSTPLRKDLARVIETCGDPRMMVVIGETNLGRRQPFSTIGSSLRSSFQGKGFHLVSRAQVRRIKDKTMTKKALEGNMEAAVSLAKNFEADVLVTGKAYTEFIRKETVRSTEMYSTKAYADIRAVVTQQAQIVGSFHKTVTEYDLSKESAGNKALQKISKEVGKSLALEVVDAFCAAPEGPARSIQLIITDLRSYSKLISIKERIKSIRGVKGIHQRLFDAPVAKLDLDFTLRPEDLAYRLEKIKEFDLKVTKFTASKIEVKVGK